MRIRHQRLRIPLALLVLRYFLYVLLGVLLALSVLAGVFSWQLASGAVLPANAGEAGLSGTLARLADEEALDPPGLSSAYRYALFEEDGALLDSDLPARDVVAVRELAFSGRVTSEGMPLPGTSSYCGATVTKNGGRLALCYEIAPQWTNKAMRDSLPNPQSLLIGSVLLSLALVVGAAAFRAGRVIQRGIEPLVRTAETVGAMDLDGKVPSSRIIEFDETLQAMDRMRLSLKESLAARQEADQRSREQIAALAHDLKTPLTTALGNAELLEEDAQAGRITAEQEQAARAIREAVLSMDDFVSRIVEASKGRAGSFSFSPTEPSALADALNKKARTFVAATGTSFLTLRTANFESLIASFARGQERLPLWDQTAIERAVLNLVGNACDHATSRVCLECDADLARGVVRLVVEDDGPGFTTEALSRGVERFYRGDASRTSTPGPLHFGLGLSIVGDIAEAHQGTLELSNVKGPSGQTRGARAVITLPCGR